MIARKLTGNAAVDAIATMAVTGNVIPATWYKTITTSSGKADLVAINILSDVLYWYRPREVRDEYTGDVIAYQKRFASDYLQRNYEQLSEHFGISKRQAKDAVVRLEELGAVKRIFRNVECGAGMMGNVMFIAIDPKRIAELTYPEQQSTCPDPMTKKRHSYDGEDPDSGTPIRNFVIGMAKIRQTYTKITQRLLRDYLLTNQPASQENFLAARRMEGLRRQATSSRAHGKRSPAPRRPSALRRRPGGCGAKRSDARGSTRTSLQRPIAAT